MDVRVEHDVGSAMRDGTILRSDVYRPARPGRYPVLLCRTPYGRRGVIFPGYVRTATFLARREFIAVVQDSRGRFGSDGEWEWLHTQDAQTLEAEDGFDSVEWAARLPESDGRVGMWGNSYDGFMALRAAGADPPSLRAIFVSGIVEKLQDENRGIFRVIYLEWLSQMTADIRRRRGLKDGPSTETAAAEEWTMSQGKWIWHLPLADIPDHVFSIQTLRLRDYLRQQHTDRWAFERIREAVRVPVCCLTGWWDADAFGTLKLFRGLQLGGRLELRDAHRLVIGPWGHSTLMNEDNPTTLDASGEFTEYGAPIASWFEYAFERADHAGRWREPISLQILNAGTWLRTSVWPPIDEQHAWYLHGAQSAGERGALALVPPPRDAAADNYTYDPRDPVMSEWDWEITGSDQARLDYRADVLSYASEPLEEAMLVAGDAACVLWVSSDAPDTDFVARLVEERPDGTTRNLCGGIIRARYRAGYERELFLERDEPTELMIEMGPVGVVVEPGTRLRLDITSSDFPSFDRNHNTGAPFWSDAELKPARQRVFHDAERPSRLLLAMMPAAAASF